MMTERFKILIQGIVLLIIGGLFMWDPVQKGALFLRITGISLVAAGIIVLVDGIFRTTGGKYKVLRILEGLLIGGFGLVFFLRNPASGALIVIYAAVWLMIMLAVLNTLEAFKLGSGMKWVLILFNLLVIWFGIQSLLDPSLAVAIFYWTVAFQLIFSGINHIILFFVLPKNEK